MTTDVVDDAHQRFIGAREAFSWPPSFARSSEWSADRASGAFSDGDRVMPKRTLGQGRAAQLARSGDVRAAP
ncbi:MAG: hypothetical protein ABWZ90_07740 [Acidimicrobiales bacterium]